MAGEQDRRILVTGVAGRLAAELVRQLEGEASVESIAGVDFREPRRAFARAEVMQADLRSRALRPILEAFKPDTVLHLQRITYGDDDAAVEEAHEINVMGTINLAATLQRTPGVRKFVLASSLHVYGGDPNDPALLTEDHKPRMPLKNKFSADLAEIEGAVNLLGRGERKIAVTCLRFADIVGRLSDEPLARYLRMPAVPSLLGYDPRLQVCHEDDALAMLKRSALDDIPGLYNVAGDGAVYLSQAVRLGGRTRIPIAPPLIGAVMGMAKFAGITSVEPHHLLMLRYGRVIDNSRMKARFGALGYTTREAILDLYGISAPRAGALEEPRHEEQAVAAA